MRHDKTRAQAIRNMSRISDRRHQKQSRIDNEDNPELDKKAMETRVEECDRIERQLS